MQKDLISSSFVPVDEADTARQFVPLPGYYQQLSTCLSYLRSSRSRQRLPLTV